MVSWVIILVLRPDFSIVNIYMYNYIIYIQLDLGIFRGHFTGCYRNIHTKHHDFLTL